jgi:hypothetical protein
MQSYSVFEALSEGLQLEVFLEVSEVLGDLFIARWSYPNPFAPASIQAATSLLNFSLRSGPAPVALVRGEGSKLSCRGQQAPIFKQRG